MALTIETEVQYLKGVGPKLGELLRKRGINKAVDLLEVYPRAYEDRRVANSISSLEPGHTVSLKARVLSVSSFYLGRSKRRAHQVTVEDSTGRIICKYFRSPYRGYFERFQPQMWVRITGKLIDYRGRLEFHHPEIQELEKESEPEQDALVPLYTEVEGIRQIKLRRLINTVIHRLIDNPEKVDIKYKDFPQAKTYYESISRGLVDALPSWILKKYQLVTRKEALKYIHQPQREFAKSYFQFRSPAQKRLIFEEFFWFEVYLALNRQGMRREKALPMKKESLRMRELSKKIAF